MWAIQGPAENFQNFPCHRSGSVQTRPIFQKAISREGKGEKREYRLGVTVDATGAVLPGSLPLLTLLCAALVALVLLFLVRRRQRLAESRLVDLLRLLPDMFFECDANWRITHFSRFARLQLGYSFDDIAAGVYLDRLLEPAHANGYLAQLRDTVEQNQPFACLSGVRRRDGEVVPCEVTAAVIRSRSGRFIGLRGVIRDLSGHLETRQTVNRLANYDEITGLPNRAVFFQSLARMVRSAGGEVVLMILDLDDFRSVNDRFGPAVGDEVLRESARRLQESVPAGQVFRLGNDQFALLFDVLPVEHAKALADHLLDVMHEPFQLGDGVAETIGARIGVSCHPQDAANAEQLFMHADAALSATKARRGQRCRFFSPDIALRLNERKQLEDALRVAIRRGELRLHYQPVVDARRGLVHGLEAVVRWKHPSRGLLAPANFIRLAEETGQIEEIGAWVLDTACGQLAAWDGEGLNVPRLAVNVSPYQLEGGALLATVRDALQRHGLEGNRLVLEITESQLMRDIGRAVRVLGELKQLGVQVAVDDFGIGYSSLSCLNRLPLDILKIDRAFISPASEAGGDTRVTEAVIALARTLRLQAVAEGVETEAQKQFLLSQGCSLMQGFHFSPPVPAEEVVLLLGPAGARRAEA